MYTSWQFPTTVSQYAEHESHISWESNTDFAEINGFDGRSIKTSKDLIYISNPTTNNIRSKTWFLVATNFNIGQIPGTISGIEVMVNANRGGRITDDTVQLYLNQEFIGDNMATATLEMSKSYGGPREIWGLDEITSDIYQSSEFGVVLRFQSHPHWPHRESILIDSLAIRFYVT